MTPRNRSALHRERLKGRKSEGRYLQIAQFVTSSPQFRTLSANAIKVFLLLRAEYNGANNGNLSIPRKEMESIGFGKSGTVFAKAIQELTEKGFVVTTKIGKYGTGCSLYAVTTEPMDACPGKHDLPSEHAPSHLWRKIPCTAPVQGTAPRQCNVKRKVNANGTKAVLD